MYALGGKDYGQNQLLDFQISIIWGQTPNDHECPVWDAKLLFPSVCAPKKIIKLVESTCRTILWNGQCQLSKRAIVAWEKVCIPKSDGDQNVINIHTWNKAAICKQLWAMAQKKDTMWVKWVYYYYLKHATIEDSPVPKQA